MSLLTRALASEPPDPILLEMLSVLPPSLFDVVEALVGTRVPVLAGQRSTRGTRLLRDSGKTKRALRARDWIGRAEVLVIYGRSGTDKSHLIEALVISRSTTARPSRGTRSKRSHVIGARRSPTNDPLRSAGW